MNRKDIAPLILGMGLFVTGLLIQPKLDIKITPHLAASAAAQDDPGLVTGQVPTAANWNSYFAGKLKWTSTGIRLGPTADTASPTAQTLSVQSVVAGTTNTAGADFTVTGSRGTGTGNGGKTIFQYAPAGTTGTAQNALVTVLTLDPINKLVTAAVPLKSQVTTVASLPSCSSALQGARAMVTDANATTFNATVAAGGANIVPVICNATNWKIG